MLRLPCSRGSSRLENFTASRMANRYTAGWKVIALAGVVAVCAPREARAQATWNDPRTRTVVELATQLRAQQLADTALADYRADAHGYLTFLAQVGQGFTEPPRIVKADELALEVYWRAPNLSKQRIMGRRDTLLLQTDIAYHRDHLGIVQNNFPNIIRLGEGDEVRDVPHPLSPAGMSEYDFSISDSLRIRLPGRDIQVYEIKVRPTDDRQPRVIGAVYIDPEGGQVVRMAFSFTRAAFIDKQLEDLSIVLENGLVGTRFWLPRRQEIEIRRTGTWLDYPVRGIIRGRWEIANYRINVGIPLSMFTGVEIVQVPPEQQRRYKWPSPRVLDSLPPDVRAVTDADVQRVQSEARALVRAQALQRARTLSLSARGVSDFARANRVEGLAIGAGLTQRLGHGFSVSGRTRYGLQDEQGKWQAALGWQNGTGTALRLFGQRDFRDAGDVQERSRVLNSIASQEFGSDYTDPYQIEGIGLGIDRGTAGRTTLTLEGAVERARSLDIHATPISGHFQQTLNVNPLQHVRVSLILERPTALFALGTELRFRAELRGLASTESPHCSSALGSAFVCANAFTLVRGSFVAELERPFGAYRIVSQTAAASVLSQDSGIPPQELVFLGGPLSGPGYDFHHFASRAGISQRLEWRVPVSFFAMPLGRFGRAPSTATLAPYANVIVVGGRGVPTLRGPAATALPARGVYPSIGIGFLTFFDLLRFDAARGLHDGRWTFGVDVSRDFWGVL